MSEDSAATPVRRIVVEVNQATSDALDRRIAAERLTASSLFNLAMQVYDAIARAEESP